MTIPPALRARLRDLRLSARSAAGASGLGMHASRSRGSGLEFAQYRGYEPGDEPRRIDWKLYARSDRFFVRESERDSPLVAWIVVDASASMGQADAHDRHFDKLAASKLLAACLIELALRQGDTFGLIVLSAAAPVLVAAASGARQRDRCLLELERTAAAGALPSPAQLLPIWERVRAGELVIVLSDFFDDALVDIAVRLAAAQRDVASIQLLGADEREFRFTGGHLFRDVETGNERRADAGSVRTKFLADFSAARAALTGRFVASGIRHAEGFLDEPLDVPLRRLFGTHGQARDNA